MIPKKPAPDIAVPRTASLRSPMGVQRLAARAAERREEPARAL